jgi:hypothetical protein
VILPRYNPVRLSQKGGAALSLYAANKIAILIIYAFLDKNGCELNGSLDAARKFATSPFSSNHNLSPNPWVSQQLFQASMGILFISIDQYKLSIRL